MGQAKIVKNGIPVGRCQGREDLQQPGIYHIVLL